MRRKFVIALLIIVALGLPATLSDALGPTAAAVVIAVFLVTTILLLPVELPRRMRQRIREASQRLERLRAEQR